MKTPDFNDFHPKDSKEADAAKKAKEKILPSANRWWLADDKSLPGAVMSQVMNIIKSDRGRIDGYNTFGKLYGMWTPAIWNGYQLSNSGKPVGGVKERLTYNLIQSCIDTTSSMIIQNKPKPMFLTKEGSSSLQRRAKKLDSFCYGLFYQNDLYKLGPKIFRDALVFGEGIVHVYGDNGIIRYERVLPYEMLVDYLESHYGPEGTKSLHRPKNIDRTDLAEMFPDKAKDIASMTNTGLLVNNGSQSVSDTVTVIESWRLPSGDKPGRHCITTANTVLHDEEYKNKFFPFAIIRHNPRLYGFFSQGMAEQLVPTQTEINRTLISIQRSLYMGGTHKIFVKNGSKVIKSHFDNMIGTIMEYAGDTPPQYIVPQLVQPEIYSHLNDMIARGYQLPGVSQMGATAMKTPGVNSGRAMRTEQNINGQRQQTITQAYENFYVDLSKITVAVARAEYEAGNKISVNVPGKRFIQTINWKEVSLEDDEFSLQIYPVSKLPQDPEGRIQTIQELMQAGLMDPQAGRRLLDFPDLEAEENLANATRDYLHKILDDIVDHGKFTAPESDDDLTVGKQLVLEYIAQGKLNNLDPDRVEMLRDFNKKIEALVNPPQAPATAQPGAGAPPGPPSPGPQAGVAPANPLPPPTSDLLPNVNQPTPNL